MNTRLSRTGKREGDLWTFQHYQFMTEYKMVGGKWVFDHTMTEEEWDTYRKIISGREK
ncbi:MAG: hypothetical protein ACJ8AG_18150 [Ktedonobacteraceae bacterium]